MANHDLVIIGAGGFGREVLDLVEAINRVSETFNFVGFVDDGDPNIRLLEARGAHLLGGREALARLNPSTRYVVAVANGAHRRTLADAADKAGLEAATLIHPSAAVGTLVEIGAGSVLCTNCSLTTNISIGRHVHINPNSTVGHDSTLEDFVTIYPLVAVSGSVRIETGASVGTGAAILQGRTVGERAFVGAGAAVVKDVAAGTTVVGVPARPRESP